MSELVWNNTSLAYQDEVKEVFTVYNVDLTYFDTSFFVEICINTAFFCSHN
jgi:hypothetical protein